MPPAVNQEINVNINALVKRIQDVKDLVAAIKSLRSQSGPVVIDEKISQNAKASVTEVDQLNTSVNRLSTSLDRLQEKQPTGIGQTIRTISAVIQGLAAAGQALDFVSSAFARIKSVGSSLFGILSSGSGRARKDISLVTPAISALGSQLDRTSEKSEQFGTRGASNVRLFRIALSSLTGSASQTSGSIAGVEKETASLATQLGTKTSGAISGLAAGLGTARLAALGLVGALTAAVAALALVGAGITALVALGTLALLPLLRFGLDFNAKIEQSQLGIAAIIASLAELRDASGKKLEGPEALTESLRLAADQIQKLKVDAINTIATFEQIAPAFQNAIGPGLAAGLTLDQIRQTTVLIVQAAGAIGLPMHQISQEVRAILEGSIDINARLAKILDITPKMVKDWKEQGVLAEELNKKLGAFALAGIKAADTLDGLTSNLQEAFSVFAGEATTKAFNALKEKFLAILPQIFDFKNARLNQSFTTLADLIDGIFVRAIGIAGDFIQQLINGAKSISRFVEANRKQLEEILDRVDRVLRVVVAITLEFGKALGRVLASRDALALINLSLDITLGLVRFLGVAAQPFVYQLRLALALIRATSVHLELLALLMRKLGLLPDSGDEFLVWRKFVPTGDPASVTTKTTKQPPGAGSGGAAKTPADTADSEFALRRALADQEFNLEKDLLDRTLKIYEDSLKARRIPIEDFYAHQEKLRNQQIVNEARHLKALLLIERDKARAEFRKIAGDKDQTPEQKRAAQQIVVNKYLAEAAQLEEKIAILKRDQAEIGDDVLANTKADTEELRKQFDTIVDELDALNGRTAKLEIGQILNRLNPILEDLKRNFGEASSEAQLLQEYIDALVNQAQLRELDGRLQIPQQQAQLETLNVETQLHQKLISQREAREQINAIQTKYLQAQLEILKNELAIASSARDQLAIKVRIAELENQLAQIQNEVDQTAASINRSLTFAFTDFFASLADGTKNLKEAFADLGTFILQMFARLAAAKLVESLFGSLLGDEQGQGGIGGILSGIFGGNKAAGDLMDARPGGQIIRVAEAGFDELVVSTDPRYAVRTSALLGRFIERTGIVPNLRGFAAGGFARSLASSFATVPSAVSQFAGGIIPAAPGLALAGAGGGDRHLTIKQVNVYDPAHVHDAMRSDGGEQVFWNFVDRNATAIKRRLKL